MSFTLKKRICFFLILFLILLAFSPFLLGRKKQPEGEYLTKEEAIILTELLEKVTEEEIADSDNVTTKKQELKNRITALKESLLDWETESYITYKQVQLWKDALNLEEEVLTKEEESGLSQKYRDSFFITKEDWYFYYGKVCERLDPQGKITREELLVLGDSSNVVDVEGSPLEDHCVVTQNGRWELRLEEDLVPKQKKASYVAYRGALWGVYDVQTQATLFNVWLVENTEEELLYFYHNYRVTAKKEELSSNVREQVADLIFVDGRIAAVEEKQEKINGKVLKISSEEVEIEGVGSFPLSQEISYYRLYECLENVGRNEVHLGYDHTDFVIADGQIQAALLVKDEEMENIRVLIKNTDFAGYYHQKIEAAADVDMELIYNGTSHVIPAGEVVSIAFDSDYFAGGRIYLRPKALTGRTKLLNVGRNNGGQGYYGSFELEKREEGILLVNEVLLEEYLYAVVPSEMPAYYPLEALKAQAISARTYAYDKMLHCGLGSYGANLDDSAAFQVYNNIKENADTTTAVRETKGKLLYAKDQLAGTYYYSTSCGFGTDAGVWNPKNTKLLPYLKAKEMSVETTSRSPEEMQTEEVFSEFIRQKHDTHFEAEESWYRWTYEHDHMSTVSENLKERLEKYPTYVSTSKDGLTWGKEPLEEGFVITDLVVQKRGLGGTIEEVLITTDKGYFLVENEYHVRAVLADGESLVSLQNGNTYACGKLLPSAFFVLTPKKQEKEVVGIQITGGGFGHGVGMSQNGAKNLANMGYEAEEILEFYYEGCQVKEQVIYKE